MKTEIECKKVVIEKDDERRFKTIRIDVADGTYQTIEISFARLKGEWIEDIYHRTICNVCGGIRRDNRFDYVFFCNRCGADMRKGANDEP